VRFRPAEAAAPQYHNQLEVRKFAPLRQQQILSDFFAFAFFGANPPFGMAATLP
jgi:hypothetical protein